MTEKQYCPECDKLVEFKDDDGIELPCDLCGTHQGYECPNCEEIFEDNTIEDYQKTRKK